MDPSENVFKYETAYDLLVRLGAERLFLRTCLSILDPVLELHPGKCYEIDGDLGVDMLLICGEISSNQKTAKMGWIGATPLRTDHLLLHIEHFGNQTNEDILDRIVCKRVEKIAELQDSLTRFLDTINLQLVIVENIDAILHDTVYHKEMGRSMQSDVVERIRKLTKLEITVILTNHITHWRGYPAPALGAFWSSQINNRFFIEKRNDDSDIRIVSAMKGEQDDGMNRIEFKIGDRGLKAVE